MAASTLQLQSVAQLLASSAHQTGPWHRWATALLVHPPGHCGAALWPMLRKANRDAIDHAEPLRQGRAHPVTELPFARPMKCRGTHFFFRLLYLFFFLLYLHLSVGMSDRQCLQPLARRRRRREAGFVKGFCNTVHPPNKGCGHWRSFSFSFALEVQCACHAYGDRQPICIQPLTPPGVTSTMERMRGGSLGPCSVLCPFISGAMLCSCAPPPHERFRNMYQPLHSCIKDPSPVHCTMEHSNAVLAEGHGRATGGANLRWLGREPFAQIAGRRSLSAWQGGEPPGGEHPRGSERARPRVKLHRVHSFHCAPT